MEPSEARTVDAHGRVGLTITEAAEALGLSASTLRLWERHDLVAPRRTAGGSRRYDETHLVLLRKIIEMRSSQKLQPRAIAHLLAQEHRPTSAPENNDPDRETIGRRLRRLRRQKGLTLKEASKAVGRSVSWLSAVETGASGMSMASLQHLTLLYESNLAELIHSDSMPLARVVRADSRKTVNFGTSGIWVSQLTPVGDKLGAQLYVLEPGEGSHEPYAHEGDELAFILSGTLEIHLASSETYSLNSGDCISFPSTIPHRWHNPGVTQTSVFWVNSPVTF